MSMDKLWSDRSCYYSFHRPDGRTFFDFQHGAIDHCVDLLSQNMNAVLALDTGLGKTCVSRAIVAELGLKALVICPGGLVRQVAAGFEQPWMPKQKASKGTRKRKAADGSIESNTAMSAPLPANAPPPANAPLPANADTFPPEARTTEVAWKVARVETGKQLQDLFNIGAGDYKVVVINRALAGIGRFSSFFSMIVCDESHQVQSLAPLRWVEANRSLPMLFLTANVFEATQMAGRYFSSSSQSHAADGHSMSKAMFLIHKTSRVLNMLNIAQPQLMVTYQQLSEKQMEDYDKNIVGALVEGRTSTQRGNNANSACLHIHIRALLGLAQVMPRCKSMVARALHGIVQWVRQHQRKMPKGDVISRIKSLLNSESLTFPPPAAEGPADDETCSVGDLRNRCDCCSMTSTEYALLYKLNSAALPLDLEVPPFWTKPCEGFTSTLIRCKDKKHINEMLIKYPMPDNMIKFVLTNEKPACYRACLIKQFASHDGQRAKLQIFRRAFDNGKAPPGLLKVGHLGMSQMFLKQMERFLARPRVLLADATVDVGFDLQRHVDAIYIPRLVATPEELHQLVGRVCRIVADRTDDKQTIDVMSTCIQGTLDEYLISKHLMKSKPAESETVGKMEIITRIRKLLIFSRKHKPFKLLFCGPKWLSKHIFT